MPLPLPENTREEVQGMLYFGARAHDYPRATPGALFESIAKDGWQTVQLALNKAVSNVDSVEDATPALLEEVKSSLSAQKLKVAVLGAYVEPSLVGQEQRIKEVQRFCAQIPFARYLEAGCIGTETTNMAKQPGVQRAEALQCLRQSLEDMLPEAEKHGVDLALEPVYYHALNTPELAAQILREMASPRLKVIFDPVNLLSPEDAGNQYALWEKCFDCFGNHITAVHIKGVAVQGGGMVSVPLEDSIVDYPFLFERLLQLGRSLPVLREEVKPQNAKADLAFLKGLAGQ